MIKGIMKKTRKAFCIGCVAFGLLMSMGADSGAEAQPEYDYVVAGTDAAALQAGLDQARGSDKVVTIYVPAGEYDLNRWLRIYSNTHLILDDGAVIRRGDEILDKNMLRNVDDQGGYESVGGYDMSHDIVIEGGTWDGGRIEQAESAADLLRIDHARDVVIKNCAVRNVYDCHLLELIGVKNASVSGCSFSGFRYQEGREGNWAYAREAIQIETAWTNNENNLEDADSYWAGGTKIDGTACDNVVIRGNRFLDLPCGVGQHHFTEDGKYRSTNIVIISNEFVCRSSMKACKTAVTCAGMNRVDIMGNKIQGPYRFGIHIEEAGGVVVDENQISKVSMNGIMMDNGVVSSLSRNKIDHVKKHGISMGNGRVSKMDGNRISNSGQNGICVTAGNVGSISKNKIRKAGNNGVSILAKARVKKMKKNKTSGCKGHGIWDGSR